MKVSDLTTHDDVQRLRRIHDPAYAAEQDRLALAEAVSITVGHCRAERSLTPSAFAADFATSIGESGGQVRYLSLRPGRC